MSEFAPNPQGNLKKDKPREVLSFPHAPCRPIIIHQEVDPPSRNSPSSCRDLLALALLGDAEETPIRAAADFPAPGDHLGSYLLKSIIGRGGMGTVFLAVGPPPLRQEFAIKVVRPVRQADGDEIIRRFQGEGESLALMKHPGIARIIEAGTSEEDVPYFVMEHFPGEAVTEVLRNQKIPLSGRLQVLRQICEAIQHAHQRGIIHRDLKPSNILARVGEHGKIEIKIIDFGIAKSIDLESTPLTLPGHVVGTPAFASPEQLLARPADTRADIYSVGALLYEFLTDSPTFPPDEMSRLPLPERFQLLTEKDPERPSFRSPDAQIPPDLDWITMRALEKNPDRRYATVSELADDIQRHLDDLPIRARPPSLTYRVGKFTRRNRLPIVAVLAVLLTMSWGMIATTAQAREAKQSEEAMARQKDRADELLGFMLDTHFKRLDRPGDQAVKVETARAIIADLEGLPSSEISHENRRTLGKAYWQAGVIFVSAGVWEDAVSAFLKGRALWKSIVEEDSADLKALYQQGLNTNGSGWALEKLGRPDEARSAYTEAVETLEKLQRISGGEGKVVWKLKLRTAYRNLARQFSESDPERALDINRKGLLLMEELRKKDPIDPGFIQAETDSVSTLIPILIQLDPAEALALAHEVVARERTRAKLHEDDLNHLNGVGVALSMLSDAQAANRDLKSALESRSEMAEIYRACNVRRPESTVIRELLSGQLYRMAELHLVLKEKEQALDRFRESEELLRGMISQLGSKTPDILMENLDEVRRQIAILE